jgi:hypothetical protein
MRRDCRTVATRRLAYAERMRGFWKADLRFGIGGWVLMWLGAILCSVTGYASDLGYGLLWWGGLYSPLVLLVWLLVLLAMTAARASHGARPAERG